MRFDQHELNTFLSKPFNFLEFASTAKAACRTAAALFTNKKAATRPYI